MPIGVDFWLKFSMGQFEIQIKKAKVFVLLIHLLMTKVYIFAHRNMSIWKNCKQIRIEFSVLFFRLNLINFHLMINYI